MDAAVVLRSARRRSSLTLRQLAKRAGTSHSTLVAYEAGTKVPSVRTLDRIVRAAGFALEADLDRRVDAVDGLDRGEELAAVLELAGAFPARHAARMAFPPFARP